MHPEATIQTDAARQGGVITRKQALSAGMTDRQIGYRLNSGQWSRVSFGGYRIFEMRGKSNLVRAATSVLPGAIASHESAAAMHSLNHADTQLVAVSVHAGSTHDFPGVTVHRNRDLSPDHVVRIDDVPTTSVARTIMDLAAATRPERLHAIVSDAIASRKTSATEVNRVLEQVGRRGKPGTAAVRRELENWIGAPKLASALETVGFRLIMRLGADELETEYAIPWSTERRFDVAFPKQRVAVEWDSRRWHTLGKAFESDRRRDAEALINGWRVLRFTWSDVHDRPEYVVETLTSILGLAA